MMIGVEVLNLEFHEGMMLMIHFVHKKLMGFWQVVLQ